MSAPAKEKVEMYADPESWAQADQYAVEFAALLDIYRRANPRRVLEIGVRRGGTLYQWIKHALPGTEVYAIDLPNGKFGVKGAPPNIEHWQKFARQRGIMLDVHFGDSQGGEAWAWAKERGPFGWLFIDADHNLNAVSSDYERYAPQVMPGGFVVFHDVVPQDMQDIGVWQLWSEITSEQPGLLLTSVPGQRERGLGVLRQ